MSKYWIVSSKKTLSSLFRTRLLTTNITNHQRVSLIEEFRLNCFQIFLISAQTSATMHGIDLDNVNIVINYNMPRSLGQNGDLDYVTYHQRLDRCGRYDKHGYLVRERENRMFFLN
jgi:superfamily II DNA/RNA helicase